MPHDHHRNPEPGPVATADWRRHPGWILAAAWLGCTLLLFALRPGYTFPPFEVIDSWVYTGYQWNLRGHLTEFGSLYYGSRLTLILPGAILHSLFPPFAANICYKLMESALLALACAFIAYRARGLPTALLAVVLSVFCPWIICALHTDYMDTAVVLYALLTMACITAAKDSRRWPGWILLAGSCFACMGISNLSTIAMPGLGLAAYHLLWLNWDFRRQLTSLALYGVAAMVVITAGGLINLRLGGPFHFLKPQLDMLTYFHQSPTNPWTPANWSWLKDATWMVISVCTLVWGLVRSVSERAGDAAHGLIRALTGGLAVSLAVAVNLELRGVGVLAHSFYASFQLCLALPLLAVCGAAPGRSGAVSPRWLLGSIGLLIALVIAGDSMTTSVWLQRQLPFLSRSENIPVLGAVVLLLVAGFGAGMTVRGRRPELLMLGIIACSMPVGFHGPAYSDRLRERYDTIHAAFRTLAREFPAGSYRFWLHPEQTDGMSLSSTMLYGYRMFTLQMFPKFEAHNMSLHTIVVPCLPRQGDAVLARAAVALAASKIDLVSPRVIAIPGEKETGMDLACFSMAPLAADSNGLIKEAERGTVVLDLQFSAPVPYTDSIIQTTFRPAGAKTINVSRGYPVFTPTDPQDYLWTPFHPLPAPRNGQPRQLSLVATMPEDGQCVCVLQIEGYHEIRRIPLARKGRSFHLVEVPAEALTLRLYFTTDAGKPTTLPTALTLYSPP